MIKKSDDKLAKVKQENRDIEKKQDEEIRNLDA